jgi:zinc transport system ATP-binding protein
VSGGDAEPLVRAEDLGVAFGGMPVLEHISLAVAPGEIVTVIGPNGSGKTTLLRAIIGLIEPDEGTVTRRPDLTVGYVPQHLHIDETLPITVGRFLRLAAPGPAARHAQALAEVGAGGLAGRPIQVLSGGERRRVLLAQALLRAPDLLVLDEPTAGVDIAGQAELYRLIQGLRERHGCAVLLVSHDLHLVMAGTDRVLCINRHVCCEGRPEAVRAHPEYRALFGHDAAAAAALGVYTHEHDHAHAPSGEVLDGDGGRG